MKAFILLIALSSSACHSDDLRDASIVEIPEDRGAIFYIGDSPVDTSSFVRTDCSNYSFSDCSASDAQGREYVFFDGALSRISVRRRDSGLGVVLPAGIVMGEPIEESARKASAFYDVSVERAHEVGAGETRTGYATESSLRAPSGVLYALELLADENGMLDEIVQRTDF